MRVAVIEDAERPENAEEKVGKVLAAADAKVIFQTLDSGHLVPVKVPREPARAVVDFVENLEQRRHNVKYYEIS
jgi:hypothetical protein